MPSSPEVRTKKNEDTTPFLFSSWLNVTVWIYTFIVIFAFQRDKNLEEHCEVLTKLVHTPSLLVAPTAHGLKHLLSGQQFFDIPYGNGIYIYVMQIP